MTAAIVLFLLFGCCFGLLTFSRRHLFSEGPTARDDSAAAGTLRDRISWALVCSSLWPILALTGLYSAWLIARRRAASAARRRE